MAITRVKPSNWAFSEKLTSSQANALDTNITFALDKRTGQSDVLLSSVNIGSGGNITFIAGSTLTINGLLNGITSNGSLLRLGSSSVLQTDSGSSIQMSGLSSEINLTGAGSHIYVDNNAFAQFKSGSNLTFDSGSVSNFNFGAVLNISGTTTVNSNIDFNGTSSISLNGNSNILVQSSTSSIILNAGSMIIGTSSSGFFLQSPQSIQFSATRTFTKLIKSAPTFDTGGYNIDAAAPNLPITTSTSSKFLVWNIDVPEGATITGYNVFIKGAPAHAGLPLNMPQVTLSGQNILTKTILFSDTVTDSSASTAAYQAAHTIGNTGLSFSVNNSGIGSCFRLAFLSESSTNALVGALIYGATITYTLSKMDDAR